MADLADFNKWLEQLECPKALTPDHVIKTLQKGVLGLVWEDLPKIVRPHYEVAEVRKNILYYKIRKEPKDPSLQTVRNTIHLKNERKKLDEKIKYAEERWRKQEYSCRQKANLLEKKKAERQNLEIKKEILKIKHKQMSTEIKNCSKMQEICHNLMPPTVEEISQQTVVECLSLVSNYSGGPEKRKVWNRISELLGPIKIPALYNAILALRSHYTDLLIHLDVEENSIKTESGTDNNIDIGIAKVCSEHINNVASRHIHSGRMKENEEITIDYVERIEEVIEELRPDLTDWLPLALEVKKLEILKSDLEKELEEYREQLSDDVFIDDTLTQLVAEIKNVDSETTACIERIQNAFGLLKMSGLSILKKKESLRSELAKFQLLQTKEENKWLDVDPSNELFFFNSNISIDALRKIMLKGEIGAYKHLQTCLNRASVAVDIQCGNGVSNFPMLRVPVYYLIDFYKTYLVNASLNKRISEGVADVLENTPESPLDSPTVVATIPYRSVLEMLKMTDVHYKRILQHSEEFDQILKTWSNQTVRDIVSKIFSDKTVYGATLDDWQKRYSSIIYVLQKSNIHAT